MAAAGEKFLEAAVVGYETISLESGWPSTRRNSSRTVGGRARSADAFGVVAAGAKFLDCIMGANRQRARHCLYFASRRHTITGGNEGATARHLAFGHAAQNGMLALLAAEQGFTGPKRALEDPRGFCLTLCNEPNWDYLQSFDSFHLPEVAFKPYPCARQLHAGVEALLRHPGGELR